MIKIKNKKKFLLILLFVVTLFSHCNVSCADTTSTDKSIKVYSDSAILIDSNSGQILYEHDAYKKVYPASTTKLMTAILTLENCKLSDTVTVTKEALSGIPSSYTVANLQVGEQFTVEQLLNVLLIPSANDAANVLACHVAGSVDNFSKMMNDKAIEIGAKNTHFVNPSGIHNDNHYSTAYDMSLIGKYARSFDVIRQIAQKSEYSLPDLPDGKERKFKSTNTLITKDHKSYYEYANGLKTGYTDKAKSCIVASASKNNTELICVVLGGDKIDEKHTYRDIDCHTLFDYGFNNFTHSIVCEKGELLNLSSVNNVPEAIQNQNIIYADTLDLMVNNSSETAYNISWENNLQLPLNKNTKVGTITYKINGKDYTVDLVTKDYVFVSDKNFLPYLFYGLIALLIIIIIFTIIKKNRKNRYHRKSRSSDNKKYFKHSFY